MSEQVLQVIDADGAVKQAFTTPLPEVELLEMYREMVLVRCFDERGLMTQRKGLIGFHLPSIGEEAAQIGSVHAYGAEDWVFPHYRVPGVAMHRGARLDDMVANLFGNVNDLVQGHQMPVHYSFKDIRFVSISSPIGTQIVQAAGVAMAAKIRKDPIVAVTYFGDGSTSSNDFHCGLNFAGVWKAPCVFFCTNNQWAISVPYASQTGSETIAQKAKAYGMPGRRVDGNDVLAVWAATREAVERARAGEGPTLIEAVSFRMGPHSSSDDPKRYRDEKTCEEWRRKDPIERFRRFLEREKVWSKDQDEALWAAVRQEVQDAFTRQEKVPPPALETMFQNVYAEMPPQLKEQLEEMKRLGVHSENQGFFPL